MKKIRKLFLIMSVLAVTLSLTGCSFWQKLFEGTHNTWFKYTGEGGMDIPLGDDSSADSTTAATLNGAEFYVCYNKNDGLKVAIQKEVTTTVSIAGGALEDDVKVMTGATKTYPDFDSAKWTLLLSTNKFGQAAAPKIVTNPDDCVDVTKALGNGIQWKKVLRDYLINQVFPE